MHFPQLQVISTDHTGGERSHSDDSLEAVVPFEVPSMKGLEFPSLASGKRSSLHSSLYPAKRHKGVSPLTGRNASESEDNSWIDNFALLDSWYPEDRFDPSNHDQTMKEVEATVANIIKRALDVSSQDIIIESKSTMKSLNLTSYPENATPQYLTSQSLPGTLQKDKNVPRRQRVIRQPKIHEPIRQILKPSNVITPYRAALKHVPTNVPQMSDEQMPSAVSCSSAISGESSVVDSSTFSVANLKQSSEPTLLTLTSYPYRVIYSNEAFSKLSGSKTSIIGDSIFDAFALEDCFLKPCLSTYPTLVGRFENSTALISSENTSSVRCAIQAYPVIKKDSSSALRYFAVRFQRLDAIQ